jgi:hypothetical protein
VDRIREHLSPVAAGADGPVPRGRRALTPRRRSILLVAWREITERTQGCVYLISTLGIIAVVVAGIVVPGLKDARASSSRDVGASAQLAAFR